MVRQRTTPLGLAVALALVAAASPGRGGDDQAVKSTAELRPVPDGSQRRLRLSLNRPFSMSKEKPEGLKKGVDDPSAMYAVLPTRVTEKGLYVAVTESPDSKTGRIHLDLDGDGDLTNDVLPNDPDARWSLRGPVAFQADVDVKVGGETVRLAFFRYANSFAKGKDFFEERGNPIFVHRDDVREGKLKLGGTTYTVLLKDLAARGQYDDLAPEGDAPAVALFVDRDGDGAYDPAFEQYDLAKPFNIGGATYELDRVTADGSELVVRSSTKFALEVPVPPTAIGRPVPRFTVKLMGGGTTTFPDDFKGKIVLLDFWATWCGPCMAGKPALVRTYDRLNGQDVEVLGVCLDAGPDRERALAASVELGMVWPQAFDGQGAQGMVAKLFGVDALPAAVLLDGTTGRVLAPADDVKADGTDKSIHRALAIRNALKGQ